MKPLSFGSLFSGVGGVDLGLDRRTNLESGANMTAVKPKPICMIRCTPGDGRKLKTAARERRQSLNQYLISLGLADYEKLLKSGKIKLTSDNKMITVSVDENSRRR